MGSASTAVLSPKKSLTTSVVLAIADAEGVDPMDLDFVLHDYVDTDAIEQLLAHDGGEWTFTFEVEAHTVTVTSDGVVYVDGNQNDAVAVQ